MRVVMVGPTAALDPVAMWDGGSVGVVQQVCEYLCWTENDLSLRPVLAESWTPNAAADTWTFTLRQGRRSTTASPSPPTTSSPPSSACATPRADPRR